MDIVADQLLTLEEVCGLLKLHRETVYSMFQGGKLPGAFKLGREWRISHADLQKFIDRRRGEAATAVLRSRTSQAEFNDVVAQANNGTWSPIDDILNEVNLDRAA